MHRQVLEKFLNAIELKQSIDFPFVACELGIPYEEIEEAIAHDEWFKKNLKTVLLRMRFKLYQSVMDLAVRGKTLNGERPNLTAVREVCNIIDSGTLWGDATYTPSKKSDLTPDEAKAFGLEDE